MTHEYFEIFDSYFPARALSTYYYDQLGSFNSDAITDPNLIDLPRYVEEVEQVRQALKLDQSISTYLDIHGAAYWRWNTH